MPGSAFYNTVVHVIFQSNGVLYIFTSTLLLSARGHLLVFLFIRRKVNVVPASLYITERRQRRVMGTTGPRSENLKRFMSDCFNLIDTFYAMFTSIDCNGSLHCMYRHRPTVTVTIVQEKTD